MRFLATILLLGAVAFAQPPSAPAWERLFNGKDLSGWKPVGNEQWKVVDGIIEGRTLSNGYGYLETTLDYSDFMMSLKFKCVGSGNSGLYFHTRFKPGTADVSQGAQVEIDCGINKHTGGIYGFGRAWIVWPAFENETVVRQDEWNEMLVIIQGNRYISRLNGVPLVDFTDPLAKFLTGTIALQLHSGGAGHMMFKDIWVKDLKRQ